MCAFFKSNEIPTNSEMHIKLGQLRISATNYDQQIYFLLCFCMAEDVKSVNGSKVKVFEKLERMIVNSVVVAVRHERTWKM